MSQDDVRRKSLKSRTSSPSLSERVRSFTTLRSRVPSTARAASTDGAETETDANVDSDDGLVSPERIRSDPGAYRDEQIAQYLDPSQPLADRVKTLERMSRAARLYPMSSLMAAWKCIKDLAGSDAPFEARKAIFAFAQTSTSHSELSADGRELIFSTIIEPIGPQHLELQAKCLRYITDKATHLDRFSQGLVQYIKQSMEKQCDALFETRKQFKGSASDRKRGQLPEERGLYSLLSLARDVIENNPKVLAREDQAALLDRVLAIAERTTSKEDMKRAVNVLSAFSRSCNIPESHAKPIVEILCAISSAISDLTNEIKDLLLRLLQSEQQAVVVQILLQTLTLSPQDRHTHTVCGALSVLQFLVENKDDPKLPRVSFALFVESFWQVHFASRRIRRECLKTIVSLLEKPDLVDNILDSNWQYLIETILTATGDEIYTPDQVQPLSIRVQSSSEQPSISPSSESSHDRAAADEINEILQQISNSLNPLLPRLRYHQRLLIARFHHELRAVLPVESVSNFVSAMASLDFLHPQANGWQQEQYVLVNKILCRRYVNPNIYGYTLDILVQRAPKNPSQEDIEHYLGVAKSLMKSFPNNQRGWRNAGKLADFVVEFWQYSVPDHTPEILELFQPLLCTEPDPSEANLDDAERYAAQQEIEGVVRALVSFLLQRLRDGPDTILNQLYLFLVHEVALNHDLVASVRLPALKLLVRFRSYHNNAVFVVKDADTLELAAALSRTEATMSASRGRQERMSVAVESTDSRKSKTSTTITALKGLSSSKKIVPKAPLWMYPGTPGLPSDPPSVPGTFLWKQSKDESNNSDMEISEWFLVVIQILQDEPDWEVYSYVAVHLPSQLCNLTLCSQSLPVLKHLRKVIVGQLRDETFHEPPAYTGVKKGDVALCLLSSLVILLGYCELFEDRTELEDMVRAFVTVLGRWERAAKPCIQALTICCHVLPSALSKRLPEILQKMSQIITKSHLSVDVLEFLGGVARLPDLYADFREDDYRMVFAICVKYLESSREQRLKLASSSSTERGYSSNRASELSTRSSSTVDSSHNIDPYKDLPQYVFVLAYHVLTVWFLSPKLGDRHKHVGWITKNLAWVDDDGVERMEEQSQVTLDMMQRATYSNLGETAPSPGFARAGAAVQKASWLVGLSIVTVETAIETGETQLTKRQASGTTHAVFRQSTSELPPHHVSNSENVIGTGHGFQSQANVFPNHVFLQLSATAAPTPAPLEPIFLPPDDIVTRSIATFDRIDTVDGYKVGVIYVGNGQKEEREILANNSHSGAFQNFLEGLGTRVRLKDAAFNTQGLDKANDLDGKYTYAWRDRVVEIVYHIPTMMLTDPLDDTGYVNKKKHIGNDYVNIIFNESGLPFAFNTFPSQFNHINILITPENKLAPDTKLTSKTDGLLPTSLPSMGGKNLDTTALSLLYHYTVHVLSQPSLPRISPAATMKLVPLTALAPLVRQLALSSSVFCNVWSNRADGEYVSSWRNRLREIARLRNRYAGSGMSTSAKYPGMKSAKTYATGDAFSGRVLMGGLAEEEGVSVGLDFSRWAGPPPSSA